MTRLALLLALTTPTFAAEPPALTCDFLPMLTGAMVGAHYQGRELLPKVYDRTAEQVIRGLDSSRTLLLADEVRQLEEELPLVGQRGECAPLNAIGARIVQRAQSDAKAVAAMLGPDYALDESVSIVLDAQSRTWPLNEAERAARVAALVHFQVSSQLLGGSTLDEAKKTIAHRYELMAMRAAERRSAERLPELYAEAFALGLDPHSTYMTPSVLADFQIAMSLSLEGIGAKLRSHDGITKVESLVPGGAADKQGQLRPGDRIVGVAQKGEEPVSTIDMDIGEVVSMIRGKKGTVVELTVEHDVGAKPVQIRIVRDTIDVVDAAAKLSYETREVGGRSLKVGILDLPAFYGEGDHTAYDDVVKLLDEARSNNIDALVLDLSNNGGGRLDLAVDISGLFIHTGAIVGTRDGEGTTEVLKDDHGGTAYSGPLVILVSAASASASEILSAALQDYDRAVVVGGTRTFGKGSVQQVTGLSRGMGALKLTMGMFFRPSGSSTQRVGVQSDIVIPSLYDGFDLYESSLDYALEPASIPPFLASTIHNPRSKTPWLPVTDAQTERLAASSKERVAADPALAAVVAELARMAKDNERDTQPTTLAELRAEAQQTDDEVENQFDLAQAALLAEAVSIAADLAMEQAKASN